MHLQYPSRLPDAHNQNPTKYVRNVSEGWKAGFNVFQAMYIFPSSNQSSHTNTDQNHNQNHIRQRHRTYLNDTGYS